MSACCKAQEDRVGADCGAVDQANIMMEAVNGSKCGKDHQVCLWCPLFCAMWFACEMVTD